MSRPLDTAQQDRITAIIVTLLQQRHKTSRPGSDDDLRQAGLSSLDMVKLVLALEQDFGVMIPESSITPANFRSMNTIGELLASLEPAKTTA